MNKRVFVSVKDWLDKLVSIHDKYMEASEFSEDVIAGLVEHPGRIRLLSGIERAAKSIARTIEIRKMEDGSIEKSFLYKGIVFFQVNDQENGEEVNDRK